VELLSCLRNHLKQNTVERIRAATLHSKFGSAEMPFPFRLDATESYFSSLAHTRLGRFCGVPTWLTAHYRYLASTVFGLFTVHHSR
jgi:hypothetical protein